MSNHPRTGAPPTPPRRNNQTTYPIPAHDPAQDNAKALQSQVEQHNQIRTGLTPGGPLQLTDPCDPKPDDPGQP